MDEQLQHFILRKLALYLSVFIKCVKKQYIFTLRVTLPSQNAKEEAVLQCSSCCSVSGWSQNLTIFIVIVIFRNEASFQQASIDWELIHSLYGDTAYYMCPYTPLPNTHANAAYKQPSIMHNSPNRLGVITQHSGRMLAEEMLSLYSYYTCAYV